MSSRDARRLEGQLPQPSMHTSQTDREIMERKRDIHMMFFTLKRPMTKSSREMSSRDARMAWTTSSAFHAYKSAPLGSAVQTGNANGGDWQEEVYEKIKSMKEMYFSKLNDLYQKITYKVQQQESLHQRLQNEQIEKLKMFKMSLERILRFMGLNKHDIQPADKEKLLLVEKQIDFFLSPNKPRKPTSSPVQEQLPQFSMQLQQPQSLDGQTNPSMQPVQGSMVAMPQNNLTNLQQSLPKQHEQQMLQNQQLRQQYRHQQMLQQLFQRKQLMQQQQAKQPIRGSMEAPLDSTSQKGHSNGADWQEEVYQKIKSMKEIYYSELNDIYQKIAYKVPQESLRQRLQNEQIEKLKMFKMSLERILRFMGLNKHDIQPADKEKLLLVEKQIDFFLSPNKPRKPTSSPVQEQLPQFSMQLQQPQSLDGQTNPSMQPVQGSMVAMPQNNLTNLQQSLPKLHKQQMLQNQQLRQQHHHRQMQRQAFQRWQLMQQQQAKQQQTTLLSQLQQSSMQLQQPRSYDGRN
ncbi:mediator of RNA polymerase II transcription subunit 15a-like [Solanum dulcamara]|uniref:mediator of RNA polymerase II transcription subunit 15a-like n=1 Tax=Solanum dulcamara TaxID=45834 RepID=UPI0024850347|nr:mediator of RNA polymerase II transcription subunit 15a-like [Solanum dulcamara]